MYSGFKTWHTVVAAAPVLSPPSTYTRPGQGHRSKRKRTAGTRHFIYQNNLLFFHVNIGMIPIVVSLVLFCGVKVLYLLLAEGKHDPKKWIHYTDLWSLPNDYPSPSVYCPSPPSFSHPLLLVVVFLSSDAESMSSLAALTFTGCSKF